MMWELNCHFNIGYLYFLKKYVVSSLNDDLAKIRSKNYCF